MPLNVYCVDEELWSERVSSRDRAEPTSARYFESKKLNRSGREKQASRARHSRAARHSPASGGIGRRGTRRLAG
jgi:hypothetical protein